MVRRLALFATVVAAFAAAMACGGEKDFTFDAGFHDAGGDAGPCSPLDQTNCPSDLKCTIKPDDTPICGQKGAGDNYATCQTDDQCKAGTACVDLEFTNLLGGQHCYPFCVLLDDGGSPKAGDLMPDGGPFGACPGTSPVCLALTFPDGGLSYKEGFCDLPADGG